MTPGSGSGSVPGSGPGSMSGSMSGGDGGGMDRMDERPPDRRDRRADGSARPDRPADASGLAPGVDDERIAVARQRLAPLGARAVVGGALGPLTTYRVGGAAAIRVNVHDEAELGLVAEAAAAAELPVVVIGKGSNLLVADAGFPGVAVVLDADPGRFGWISLGDEAAAAGAAAALPVLARQSVEAGLTGLEWAVGVPGSVGGALRMNAGGHGSDIARSLESARVFDLATGSAHEWPVERFRYAYRHSAVGPDQVVVSARFALAPGSIEAGRQTIREIVRWRREHQPGGQNAGSVFTNPPGDSAGRIIEECGLKGRRLGTAMISTKHANFIQADPGGYADDVHALMLEVQDQVARLTGRQLVHEVRLVGFEDQPSSRGLESGGSCD